MKKLKVTTVVGTRPEIIRLSSVIKALNRCDSIKHVLVHTGQNYDYTLNEVFFNDFGLERPDHFLDAATGTAIETIGNILIKIDKVLESEAPDAVLILGDTNSCLSALAAKKRKIPIFHMEAGNRCFDQRVPEETNRKIVDHVSDINLTYSDIAREYLLREGIPADRIIKTGSPMFEVLRDNEENIRNSLILSKLDLEPDGFYVVSAHREENIESDTNFFALCDSLNQLASKKGLPIIVSTHPRTSKRIHGAGISLHENIQLLKPLGFFDFNKLQVEAKAVLSDSGTISEESSILNFRALNIREAHERPEAMEETPVIMSGLNAERIFQALDVLEKQEVKSQREFRLVGDYSMPNVSAKVVRIILSYVDYVNRTVWSK